MSAAGLVFSRLTGESDLYLWVDLDDWHEGREVEEQCEHGVLVTRCSACGAPVSLVAVAECPHLVDALDELTPGQAALVLPAHSNGVRVERIAEGVARWAFSSATSCRIPGPRP